MGSELTWISYPVARGTLAKLKVSGTNTAAPFIGACNAGGNR